MAAKIVIGIYSMLFLVWCVSTAVALARGKMDHAAFSVMMAFIVLNGLDLQNLKAKIDA